MRDAFSRDEIRAIPATRPLAAGVEAPGAEAGFVADDVCNAPSSARNAGVVTALT